MKILKGWGCYSDDELYLRTRGIVAVCNVLIWIMVLFGALDFIGFIFSVCRQSNTFIILFLIIGVIVVFFGVGVIAIRYVTLEAYDALRYTSRPDLKRIVV